MDVVVETGSGKVPGPAGPPVMPASLRRPPEDEERTEAGSSGSFLEAVAAAHEAGLTLSLAGLFAGEERPSIPLPG